MEEATEAIGAAFTVPAIDQLRLAKAIDRLLRTPQIDALVAAYLEGPPHRPFAGTLFDDLGRNDPKQFTVDDIAAVSLLDVRFSPRAVHTLINDGGASAVLAAVRDDVDLWAPNAPLQDLRTAYYALRRLDGVGPTKASKLLARKRPRLAPITDSVVETVLETDGWSHLEALALVLQDNAIRDRLTTIGARKVTEIRALDIAIWMFGSASEAAAKVRAEFGVPGLVRRA